MLTDKAVRPEGETGERRFNRLVKNILNENETSVLVMVSLLP